MSRTLVSLPTLTVTAFHGGALRGPCLQFTTGTDSMHLRFPPGGARIEDAGALTREQVDVLLTALRAWLQETEPRRNTRTDLL